ncbi:MAG TPA: hypothetical protein VGF79_05155 [Bacteroidia bacterium]
MRNIIFLIAFHFACFSQAQNYFDYTRLITQTDSMIISGNYHDAMLQMDLIDRNFDFIYASHCVKGLQLSLINSDSLRSAKWLKRCMIQGVPLWMLKQHEITSKVFNSSVYTPIIAQHDSFRAIYLSRINLKLRKIIDSLTLIDQFRTDRVNNGFIVFRYTVYGIQWLNRNRKNFEYIKSITEQYGFPGERLIGVDPKFDDSLEMKNYFSYYGPEPLETSAFIMLIHYYSSPGKNINSLLIDQARKGNLPSYQYASINDFIAEYGKSKNDSIGFYNEWHIDTDSTQNKIINSRRAFIGLGSFEFKRKLNKLELNARLNKGTLRAINLN